MLKRSSYYYFKEGFVRESGLKWQRLHRGPNVFFSPIFIVSCYFKPEYLWRIRRMTFWAFSYQGAEIFKMADKVAAKILMKISNLTKVRFCSHEDWTKYVKQNAFTWVTKNLAASSIFIFSFAEVSNQPIKPLSLQNSSICDALFIRPSFGWSHCNETKTSTKVRVSSCAFRFHVCTWQCFARQFHAAR